MDVIKQYFELVKGRVDTVYEAQKESLAKVAVMFGECMDNGGVVQLFGIGHCEEFMNELNYRAGGIAPFHGLRLKDMVLKGLVDQEDIDSLRIRDDLSVVDKFYEAFEMDDRDMYCLISFCGDEPLLSEIARRAKANGQKVVAVINKASYDKAGGTLLEYADLYLDMGGDEPDVALKINGLDVGQLSSTVANVTAQMLTAELYNWFISRGKDAPVLLSANVKGADVHNNSLTDPYGRRVR